MAVNNITIEPNTTSLWWLRPAHASTTENPGKSIKLNYLKFQRFYYYLAYLLSGAK